MSAPARRIASRLSKVTARSSIQPLAAAALIIEYSPLTEFKNGSTDWLFFSVGVTPPDIGQLNINTFPTAVATASEGNGTSAMVIDNDSASAQASSFYFATLGTNAAVKLTQAGLQ